MHHLWTILGFCCLFGSAIMIRFVKEATLGEDASRLVGVILAVAAYYYAARGRSIKYEFVKYAVPVAAVIGFMFLISRVRENWKKEIESLLESSWKLMITVALGFFGGFLLSVGQSPRH